MTNKNKILLYLDGQLSGKEKTEFENQLKNSPELQEEFENLKKKFSALKELNNIEFDDSYFIHLVPNVRGRLEKKNRKFLIPRFAFSTIGVILVAVILLFTFNKKENIDMNSIQQITANMNNNELDETLNLLNAGVQENSTLVQPSEKADSLIDQALVNEISPSISWQKNYFTYDDTNINSYISDLTEHEADQIYSQLLKKRYF